MRMANLIRLNAARWIFIIVFFLSLSGKRRQWSMRTRIEFVRHPFRQKSNKMNDYSSIRKNKQNFCFLLWFIDLTKKKKPSAYLRWFSRAAVLMNFMMKIEICHLYCGKKKKILENPVQNGHELFIPHFLCHPFCLASGRCVQHSREFKGVHVSGIRNVLRHRGEILWEREKAENGTRTICMGQTYAYESSSTKTKFLFVIKITKPKPVQLPIEWKWIRW